MLARKHLLDIQRAMYRRLRSSANNYFGRLGPELERYFLQYQKEFQRFGRVSSKKTLISSMLNSQITLCGDYHTLDRAQRTALDLMAEVLPTLRKSGRDAILALEMLPFARSEMADRFLRGDLGEKGFLKAIGFRDSWGFDWGNYRELFAFAARHGVRIVGLNGPSAKGTSPLRVRDRFAARVLADLSAGSEKNFVFGLVGDLHLAQAHLPGDLRRALAWKGIRRRLAVVHQNQEDLYWKLAERGLENRAEVVQMRDGVFCVMNTPPWVKLQSLVRWGELAAAGVRPGTITDGGADPFVEIDFSEELLEVLHVIQSFLGIEGPVDSDFRICGPKEVGWLARRRGLKGLSQAVRLEAVGKFQSHFIPGENLIFLSDYGLSPLATQAAFFLHFHLSGFEREFVRPRRDFYPFVWVEALGFLGAKIINPRVVPPTVSATARRFPADSRSVRCILQFYAEAKALGAQLGDALFHAVVRGRVSREVLRGFFENPFSDPAEAKQTYLRWTERLAKNRS